MKYLSFDLEIVKPLPVGCTDWKEHRPLGISCAATLASDVKMPILWYHGQEEAIKQKNYIPGSAEFDLDFYPPQAGAMTQVEINEMLKYMLKYIDNYYELLTWNGLMFDFDVLAEESDKADVVKEIAWENHVDMMFHFFCVKGYMLGLDAAAKGLGLEGKMEGMKGDLAPLMWMDDPQPLIDAGHPELAELDPEARRRRVLRYVTQDVWTTLYVAQEAEKRKKVEWTSKAGKHQVCYLPDGWSKVSDAIWLEEPDTSWMTNPFSRERFYSWID